MRRLLVPALAFLALAGIGGARPASADQIELSNGQILHGKPLLGQSTEEAVAVELYETGGVTMVRWDHVEESRRKQLRIDGGFDTEEGGEIVVPGHDVLLANGTREQGLALNPDQKDRPLQLKTATGVKEYPRDQVARITGIEVPGLLAYTPDELYGYLRDKNPPEGGAAHKDLANKCMQIGALKAAREHLNLSKADAVFAGSPEGRQLDAMLRQLDVLEKSAGARALKTQIQLAMRGNRWNEAKTTLESLASQFKDEAVRKIVGYSLLESQVHRGRDNWFKMELPKRIQSNMGKAIDAEVKKRKPRTEDPEAPRGIAQPGTLAAIRQFLQRDLPKQLWDKTMADLGLTADEMDVYWKARNTRQTYTANYGTGSFIVIKKPQPTGNKGNDPNRQRRPPGTARDDQRGGPPKAAKEDKPRTEEEWWDAIGPQDRARWATAWFVESSGVFEVLRTDETELCDNCGGRGVNVANSSDGGQSSTVCPKCNTSGKFRKVIYR